MKTIETTCCFTGLRPQKISFDFYDEKHPRKIALVQNLTAEIQSALNLGIRHFISGGAIGVDLLAAKLVLQFQKKSPDLGITLEIAVPCPNQDKYYTPQERKDYRRICKRAKVNIISSTYSRDCYFIRNKYMVDNSALVIAVHDGQSGGTKYTIDYAISMQRTIKIISP